MSAPNVKHTISAHANKLSSVRGTKGTGKSTVCSVPKLNPSSKKTGGSGRKTQCVKSRGRKIEMLDSNFLVKNNESPVTVENEISKVNVQQRIQIAAGIQPYYAPAKMETVKCIPCISSGGTLNEPRFQSSLSLMRNLEELKNIDIDAHQLLKLKLTEDKNFEKAIEKKATSAVTIESSYPVYKQLQSLSLNSEVFVSHQEWKHQNLAQKYAPKRSNRDPDLHLSDFIHPHMKQDDHTLPCVAPSFTAEFHQNGYELFLMNSVHQLNHLSAYELCII